MKSLKVSTRAFVQDEQMVKKTFVIECSVDYNACTASPLMTLNNSENFFN